MSAACAPRASRPSAQAQQVRTKAGVGLLWESLGKPVRPNTIVRQRLGVHGLGGGAWQSSARSRKQSRAVLDPSEDPDRVPEEPPAHAGRSPVQSCGYAPPGLGAEPAALSSRATRFLVPLGPDRLNKQIRPKQ